MGSSPEGSVGNFTSTSFRKMGCKTLGKARVLLHNIQTDAFNTEQFRTDLSCACSIFPLLPASHLSLDMSFLEFSYYQRHRCLQSLGTLLLKSESSLMKHTNLFFPTKSSKHYSPHHSLIHITSVGEVILAKIQKCLLLSR